MLIAYHMIEIYQKSFDHTFIRKRFLKIAFSDFMWFLSKYLDITKIKNTFSLLPRYYLSIRYGLKKFRHHFFCILLNSIVHSNSFRFSFMTARFCNLLNLFSCVHAPQSQIEVENFPRHLNAKII